jgi:hypothetical protein
MTAEAEHSSPGDPHHYRITCTVCGEQGTIRLTVDPQTISGIDPAIAAERARIAAAVRGLDPRGQMIREVLGGPDYVLRASILAIVEGKTP